MKAGFVCHNEQTTEDASNILVEAVDAARVRKQLSGSAENTDGALWEDYLGADNAATSGAEASDKAIVIELLSEQEGTLSDGDDRGSGISEPPSMAIRDAL